MSAALKGRQYDWALNVQGDEPLIAPGLLRKLLARCAAVNVPSIITAAERMADAGCADDANAVKVVLNRKQRALYFSRSPIPYTGRAEVPTPLFKHIGIYLFHRAALQAFVSAPQGLLERIEKLEQLRAFDLDIPIEVVVTGYHPVNVDAPSDIRKVERLLGKKRGD
jgi:3-deoxy-manno-octulosonate cytidylyltransferase (CMP-KDO synthetase)